MTATLVVIIAGLALLVMAWFLWRRYQRIAATDALARKPVQPSSPYPPSRGFKALGALEQPEEEQIPEAPRLSIDGDTVFGEGVIVPEAPYSPALRQADQWALERSNRRMPQLRLRRRHRPTALAAVLVGFIVAVVVLAATGLF